jgi:hypothetical protein
VSRRTGTRSAVTARKGSDIVKQGSGSYAPPRQVNTCSLLT